jgi:hypothetical protein
VKDSRVPTCQHGDQQRGPTFSRGWSPPVATWTHGFSALTAALVNPEQCWFKLSYRCQLSWVPDSRSRQQMADLLGQTLVDDGWAWDDVAARDARAAPRLLRQPGDGGPVGEVERLPGGTTEVLASPPTCRWIAAARRDDVMVAEYRHEVGKRAFPWTPRERFPLASTVGGDQGEQRRAQRFPGFC